MNSAYNFNLPIGIRALRQLVLVHVPLSLRQRLPAGQRGHTADKEVLGDVLGRGLGQDLGQTRRLALLLGSNKRLLAGLANQLDLGARGAADGEQADDVGLADDAQLRVVAAGVALPVGVAGNVGGGQRDGVLEGLGGVGAGRGIAKVRVERHAVGSVRVDGQGLAEGLPDAGGLEGLLL